jgi:alanine dehydrogenase
VTSTPPLLVGVPTETKEGEHRVAVTPDGVHELALHGVRVLVQAGAGGTSAIADDDYRAAGAELVAGAAEVWERAEVVLKVKEPQPHEIPMLRPGLVLFTYLHLAAYPEVAAALVETGVTGIAYETVETDEGDLPLLAPMSEVAGRMATQVGAHFLEAEHGGRGVLLGGVPGVRPARVVVLGAGNVGWNTAWIAQGMQAEVLLLDRALDRLRSVDKIHQGRIVTLASNRGTVARAVADADLVIGAVLVAGGRAPVLVTEDMVRAMKRGSVIVDCAVDQGGCVETTHETTHADPVFERHGVLHYAVGNMPAAVPRTSTYALANATLPYLVRLATVGLGHAASQDAALARGINTLDGALVHPAVADALGRPLTDLDVALCTGG